MDYISNIQKEEVKNSYNESDLLNKKYLFGEEKNIKVYYAPFEYINRNAKIIIVGITPGWLQMKKSYKSVITTYNRNKNWEEAIKEVKKEASFAGLMRKNLISMLDELELNKKLNINTTLQLFEDYNSIIHTTSIIKYPTFYKDKNYNGKHPSPLKSEILSNIIKTYFIPEINNFQNKLIIPLGNCVSNVFTKLNEEHILNKNIYLNHFPHPSGRNTHRKKQFEEYKSQMFNQIKDWKIKD